MRAQAELAIETADVIIFVTDSKAGLTDADMEVGNMLRRSHKPVVVAVNKMDSMTDLTPIYEFYSLGLGDPMPLSAEQGKGVGDLLDEVVQYFPKGDENEGEEDEILKVAVIGKPNAGKSSLINRLLGEERVIVSDIAEPRGRRLTRWWNIRGRSTCLLIRRGFAAGARSTRISSGFL